MGRILCGTTFIFEDEPCLVLFECDRMPPDGRGKHRYRVYRVMREGRITEFEEDLGDSKLFEDIEGIISLGGIKDPKTGRLDITETVGSLREMADQYRHHVRLNKAELVAADKIILR